MLILKNTISNMAKDNESKFDKQEEKLSICNIIKEDASEIIPKTESHIPY
mgnify:CR=1 FL=1